MRKTCASPIASLTFSRHQCVGSAAAEAVQQRLGSDVAIEKRGGAADLHQTQPQPQEHGLVAQEQRHRVALVNAAALQENSGSFVAEFIGVLVGERLILITKERLVRLRLHQLQKAVQDEVISLIIFQNAAPNFQLLTHVLDIPKEVRIAV